jgi:cysteine synthase A
MNGNDTARRLSQLGNLVGNTPLLAIDLAYKGERRRVWAKAENLNMTGSIKDRMALNILRRGHERGLLEPGGCIAEATSGNTGISFAALGRALGHPVMIFMPDWMSEERKALIRSLGAQTRLVSRDEGGFVGCIEMANGYASEHPGTFLPRQFENEDNVEAHATTTGPEIWWQLDSRGLRPDAFVAGVGTGGTIMGVGRYLREQSPECRIHPLEPENSPTLRTGHQVGEHRIQGISDEFVPAICDLGLCDEIVSVDDGDAIIMAQRLAAELGLGVGISSGANLLGALLVLEGLDPDSTVVTVFSDDNKKYLSTALLADEPAKPGMLSPDVELLGFDVVKRACVTCCEGDDCERVHWAAKPGVPVREDCPARRSGAKA